MIRLVSALDCEAKPLLATLRLRRDRRAQGFTVYRNDEGVALIISGVGRLNAAAAVAYLQGYLGHLTDQPPAAWLNIGSGGHARCALGGCYLAHKICEAATGRRWYPGLVFTPPCATATVTTVDQPQTDYAGDTLYEMEASGFYATACRFATSELIQVVKIISDNQAAPVGGLNSAGVAELIAAAGAPISAVIEQLRALAAELAALEADPPLFATLQARFRFSESERQRLRTALRRWQVRYPGADLPAALSDGRAALRWLEQQLATTP